jgi:hypothetical protein
LFEISIANKANGNIGYKQEFESQSWIEIRRNPIDCKNLSLTYGKRPTDLSKTLTQQLREKIIHSAQKYRDNCSFLGWITSLFPILTWIRSYSIKNCLLNDTIAGFTISILHIPQGMANGILAGLTPINGLYVSFFPVLIYALMGTGYHTSIGNY